MIRKIIPGAALLALASCTQSVQIEVSNSTQHAREAQTVEIAWTELRGVKPETVVVTKVSLMNVAALAFGA